jgi:tetratricopeptide (TPR) repeat protein
MTRTVLLLSLLLGASSGAQESPRRVAVLPFQALSGDVPGRAGPRVTQRLATEVRGVASLELAEPPAAESPPDGLAQARAAVKEAESRRQKHDFAGAEASLDQALDTYTTPAVAVALPNGSELADAYALRAAVRYSQGRDEEAARALSSALTLSPGRDLPLASTSPLFARTVERVRAALQKQPRGSVRFVSVPPGVPVTLDGQSVTSAPVRVVEVPPGLHLWRAVLPSGEATGGLVEAISGKEVEVKVLPPGEGPGAVLAAALAGNRLDAAAVDAAAALGQTLRADLAVFGTVSRTSQGLALDAFLLAPGSKTLRRVPRIALDTDLLDAGPPLRELSAMLASRGAQLGEPVSVPVAPSAVPVPASRPAQVKYPVEEKPVSTPKPVTPTPERAPLTPRKPLVRP